MKDKYIFYTVSIFAVFVICAIGIGYATDTFPLYKQNVPTILSSTIDTTQVRAENLETATTKKSDSEHSSKKEDCDCCKKRMEKFRKQKMAAQSTENTSLK